jgi:EAL domain-containing protein (putative c-di-GMP-specific phosphodiesterase class I)
MSTVAQGVETQAECDLLVELQCEMAQGDYIAKPMARASYMTWLREWGAKSVAPLG